MPLWIQKCRCSSHFIFNQLMLCYIEWLPWVSPPQYGTHRLFTFSYHQSQSILRQGRISTCCLGIKAFPQGWREPQGISASWAAHYTNFPLPPPIFSAMPLPGRDLAEDPERCCKVSRGSICSLPDCTRSRGPWSILLNPHWRGKNNFSA